MYDKILLVYEPHIPKPNVRDSSTPRTGEGALPEPLVPPSGLGDMVIGSVCGEESAGLDADKLRILDGSLALAREIVAKYPQVNKDGELNYYFTGSLAAMLLARAETIEVLATEKIPTITAVHTISVPESVRVKIGAMARPIGDLDFAYTTQNGCAAGAEWLLFDANAYFSDSAKSAIKSLKPDSSLGCDATRIIAIDGQVLYITEPLAMLATYKAMHLVEGFAGYPNKGKLTDDFIALADGLSELYGREVVVRAMSEHVIGRPRSTLPLNHPEFQGCRTFFEEAIAIDKNAGYLQGLRISPERHIGVLGVLKRFKDPKTKERIISFINEHSKDFDNWEVDVRDPRNIDVIAKYILENLDLLKKHFNQPEYLGLYSGIFDQTEESINIWLEDNPSALREVERMMPLGSATVKSPGRNSYYDVLTVINEDHYARDLNVIGKLMETFPNKSGSVGSETYALLVGAFNTNDPQTREQLFAGLSIACQSSFDRLEELISELEKCTRYRYFDNDTLSFREISDERRPEMIYRPEMIQKCFERFGVFV